MICLLVLGSEIAGVSGDHLFFSCDAGRSGGSLLGKAPLFLACVAHDTPRVMGWTGTGTGVLDTFASGKR